MLRPRRGEYERQDIFWSTWVPDPDTRQRIFEIVRFPEERQRMLAKKITGSTHSPVTARFAQLALNRYDPQSENLLADAQAVAKEIQEMGDGFKPDVRGLFEVYLLFLQRTANFWFKWVNESSYNPSNSLPSWFPVNEGALAVSRQIEWAVSRAPASVILAGLQTVLESERPRERFGAAQLVEWAQRTANQKGYWRFGGGSGPEDTLSYTDAGVMKLKYQKFSPDELAKAVWLPSAPPMIASPLESASEAPVPPQPEPQERQISFWIKETEGTEGRLEAGQAYTGNFRVGKPVAGNLMRGPSTVVPSSDVPPGGLLTNWTVVPSDTKLEAVDESVLVSTAGLAAFSLLVPESGDSPTVQVRLTPLNSNAKLLVLIHVGGKLYRELEISLKSTPKIARDVPLTRAAETNLQTTHEWTTPPGVLTLYISKPGRAAIFGYSGSQSFPPGQEITVGTDRASLSNAVDDLRRAAEDFRKTPRWTEYLNDIDGADLLQRLGRFTPQYDWSKLDDFADAPHATAWDDATKSSELHDLAFYGRRLYDTLFPTGGDSRGLLENLLPGQRIDIVWRQDSEAGWVPHLPWALLYVGDVDGAGPVDATKFWGLRFRLQYTAYNALGPGSSLLGRPEEACCTSVLFFGNSAKEPATAEAQWQRQIWTSLGAVSRSCLVPAIGASTAKAEVLKALREPETANAGAKVSVAVLYLFCHYGLDSNGKSILRFGLDASEPKDVLREPEIGTAMLASRPLVFANACATAGTDIYSANALTKSFFDRGCRAFIGTDCMVPASMASRFAITFFHFLLRLADQDKQPMAAGEAIAQTRLFLWCHYRNIGGLFYSYLNQYDLYMASQNEIDALRTGV
ncbi:MAG: CHAT domain-containing protein [Acidobacteriaceae bacterium]|nr:CHAT domain-containing protein [Acidobacteriaceae bacterium]